jgi:hypothetical protein
MPNNLISSPRISLSDLLAEYAPAIIPETLPPSEAVTTNTVSPPTGFVEVLCAHCRGTISNPTINQQRNIRTESGETLCTRCAVDSGRYVFSPRQSCYIRSYDRITLADTSEWVSQRYAASNCYYSDTVDAYYTSTEAAYEDEQQHRENIERESRVGVYDYHATNPIEVHNWDIKTPRNSLCFGVELEMEHKNDDYEDGQHELAGALGGRHGDHGIDSAKGKYILMRDGSLNDSGVELITVPYTLEAHQTIFGWKEILGTVTGIGRSGRGTNACGMHVHVNRAALSAFTLGKMLVFVNSPGTTALIEKIAQRDPEEWARRYSKRVRDGLVRETDKYEAMHLSSRTVEFRIFRGNLRHDRVLKNIEFCHAVVMYAKDTSMQDLEKPTLFVSWLAKRKGTYPNLAKFLSETAFNSRLNAAANAGSNARPSTTVRTSEEI